MSAKQAVKTYTTPFTRGLDGDKHDLLMFTGLMDTICPPSTQFAMYNKVTSKKDVVIYPEYGHEGLKGSDDIIFEFLSNL